MSDSGVLHERNISHDEDGAAGDQVFVDDADADSLPSAGAKGGAWELSKENVLPLRAGRRVKCLNEAVARDSLSQDSALREERHVFETELRGCALEGVVGAGGSTAEVTPSPSHLVKLLGIWHRYVVWTEQNYPSGKEINEVLQRSLQAFPEATGDMARVADQPDYVDLWLKLANQREEPGDIFQFMYSKKIGRGSATFYEQWAWHLEDLGNTKKASAVLTKGISNVEAASIATKASAEGSDAAELDSPASCNNSATVRLEKLKADLELRVVRGMRSGVEDMRLENEENEGGAGPSRKTLGDLRGKGKHMTAPNMRVGPKATIPGMRRGISGSDNHAGNHSTSRASSTSSASGSRPPAGSTSNTPSTASSSAFRIFSDDNDYHDVVSESKFAANPVDSGAKSKENTQKPTQWNKVKVKQKVSSIPTTPLTPSFDIHIDDVLAAEGGATSSTETSDGVFKTPAKTINLTHSKPLSTKKVVKELSKPLDFLEKVDEGKTEEKFMFCKDKVYQGLEEFSFEEIKFEMWKLKRKA